MNPLPQINPSTIPGLKPGVWRRRSINIKDLTTDWSFALLFTGEFHRDPDHYSNRCRYGAPRAKPVPARRCGLRLPARSRFGEGRARRRTASMFLGEIRRSKPSYAQGFGGLSSSFSSPAIGRACTPKLVTSRRRGLLRRRTKNLSPDKLDYQGRG